MQTAVTAARIETVDLEEGMELVESGEIVEVQNIPGAMIYKVIRKDGETVVVVSTSSGGAAVMRH
ncbi:hypothetical protein ACODYM_29490 [Burkholderia gladioli]|uniref:hypothetical protein n=1 Tax=Burkholderia gladioli TaxID=28095 RepID=UPI003B503144